MSAEKLIFISHAAVDQDLAIEMKGQLTLLFPLVDVFVSSDPEDLPLGDPWVDAVLQALDRASLILLIATERSLSRRWVWFEAGRAWFSKVKCIPCCVGKIRKNKLPRPLDGLTAMDLDSRVDLASLFTRCSEILEISQEDSTYPSKAWETFARLDVRAEEKQKLIELPFHSELRTRVQLQMEQLDSGSRECLRLLLMLGELTEGNAMTLVRRSGKYTNSTMGLIGLEAETGWLLKTRSSPYPHASREEDAYVVKENVKSILKDWFAYT